LQSVVYHLDNEGTSKKFYASNVVLSTGTSPVIPILQVTFHQWCSIFRYH